MLDFAGKSNMGRCVSGIWPRKIWVKNIFRNLAQKIRVIFFRDLTQKIWVKIIFRNLAPKNMGENYVQESGPNNNLAPINMGEKHFQEFSPKNIGENICSGMLVLKK